VKVIYITSSQPSIPVVFLIILVCLTPLTACPGRIALSWFASQAELYGEVLREGILRCAPHTHS
jgi:hypothetical protein